MYYFRKDRPGHKIKMARPKDISDSNFEIKFYEAVLKESPDFVEVLMALGELYTRTGQYELGLQIDQRLTQLRPQEGMVFYNLSCSFSLLNRIEDALSALKRSVDLGYQDWSFMEKDPDLENLRRDSRFLKILEDLKPAKRTSRKANE